VRWWWPGWGERPAREAGALLSRYRCEFACAHTRVVVERTAFFATLFMT
jgi:hypothetical protein